jgi:hypothetical protein
VGAERILRRLRELLDVDTSGAAVGDSLVLDVDGETWVAGTVASGSSAAADVTVAPAGSIASTNVQDALEELDAEKAAASHVHAGEEITSGTVADARIAATIARDTEVTAAVAAHTGDTSDAHDASAISVVPFGSVAATDVQGALEEIVSEAVTGAPTGADYLVGTTQGALSAEIVVGATPGGELGGTWASPTVDATHSGSSHAGVQAAAEATAAAALDAHVTDATDAHDATAISTVPAGNLAATNVQTSLAELDSEKAATSHAHAGEDITSGTIADARIASTIARDSEVSAAISAHEAAGDPHPGYVTPAEAVTAIVAALNAADGDALGDDGAGVLSVNVDGSTIEVSSDALRVKASGITANEIAANAVGSSELADDAVDTNAIVNGAVTAAKVAADVATQAELDAHVSDSSAAHAASAVSADSTTLVGTGTDVQAVLEELDNGIADHLADSSAAHAASAISASSATLSGTGTDVQAVLEELDNLLDDHSARHENGGADEISIAGLDGTSTELAAHLADATDAHDASAISVVPFSTIAATTVQAALEEIVAEAGGPGGGSGEALEVDIAQTGHGLSVGNVVRLSGANYVKAQANSVANAEAVGIVSAVADADNFTLTTGGLITTLSGLSAGTVYFVDDDTSGLLTATEPTDPGDVSKPALLASSATAGYVIVAMRGIVVPAAPDPGLSAIEVVIDGALATIQPGVKAYVEVPFACEIEAVTMLADASGSIVVDVWRDTYANYPPTNADSITAGAVPTISSSTKSRDATLTGWSTSLAEGDVLAFNVDSATTVTLLTLSLLVRRIP